MWTRPSAFAKTRYAGLEKRETVKECSGERGRRFRTCQILYASLSDLSREKCQFGYLFPRCSANPSRGQVAVHVARQACPYNWPCTGGLVRHAQRSSMSSTLWEM